MSSRKSNGPGPIPPRWLHCPRKSSALVAGKFLAFKTPLDAKYDSQVPEEFRFPPKMIFDTMRSHKVKIGLWIDLTYTSRFYDKKDVEDMGCKYLKLECRGHGETPSEEQTNTFVQLCANFISHHPLEIIGIHCTHGFNRTGFLIASYLVENQDWSVEAAVGEFSRVRPPGIYKADYLQELFRRYGDVEDAPPAPLLPDWYTESDDSKIDEDGEPLNNGNGAEEGPSGRRRREFKKKNPVFMDGVPGVTSISTQPKLGSLQKRVQAMCGWKDSGFPGCQPVSMDLDNINFLHKKPYKVSWKADGTRYMMLIDGEENVYFIDRDNCVFQVAGLHFPHRKDLKRHLKDTLLDGEMVIDRVNDECFPRYLVYDIIRFEGQPVGKTDFNTRLICIEKEIVGARNTAIQNGLIDRSSEPFSVRLKQFWDLTNAKSLLGEKFKKNLAHEPDGLIFQPTLEPYVAGRSDEVLKWKPASLNSVDFKLKLTTEKGEGILPRKICELYVGGYEKPFAVMKFQKLLKDLNNKIVECKFEKNAWAFMRERTDKSFPNSYKTAHAVCNSICNPVTEAKLLDFIDQHRWRKEQDRDLMPPPSKVPRR